MEEAEASGMSVKRGRDHTASGQLKTKSARQKSRKRMNEEASTGTSNKNSKYHRNMPNSSEGQEQNADECVIFENEKGVDGARGPPKLLLSRKDETANNAKSSCTSVATRGEPAKRDSSDNTTDLSVPKAAVQNSIAWVPFPMPLPMPFLIPLPLSVPPSIPGPVPQGFCCQPYAEYHRVTKWQKGREAGRPPHDVNCCLLRENRYDTKF